MAGIETSVAPVAVLSRLRAAVVALAGRLAALWQAIENRRQIGRLATLDDRYLADIGITRGDVHAALASSLSDNPSNQLRALAGERRRAAHDLRTKRRASRPRHTNQG
jgi:uncharacterized protein YjiS (DUF1127 family)